MDLGISGRTVFFTGASKGMGRVAATMLAEEGCKVAVVARGKDAVDETVEEIRATGGTAMGVIADIAVLDDVKRAVAEVREAFGAPLIVVGQTKFVIPGDFADIDDTEHYVDSFRTYTMSQLYLLKEVLPAMQQARWGRYVHIGSATAKEPVGLIHHAIRERNPALHHRAAQDGGGRVREIWHHGQHGRPRLDPDRQRRGVHLQEPRARQRRGPPQVGGGDLQGPCGAHGQAGGDRLADRLPLLGPRWLHDRRLDRSRRWGAPLRFLKPHRLTRLSSSQSHLDRPLARTWRPPREPPELDRSLRSAASIRRASEE